MSDRDPAASAATDVVGDIASLDAGQVLLPGFMARRPDGLWVDISSQFTPELFQRFVERVFDSAACFAGLDYGLFLRLLYMHEDAELAALLQRSVDTGQAAELRLADDIVPFPPQRQALYRGVKVLGDGEAVEYLFEPVAIEVETQVPRFDAEAAPDASGARPILGYDTVTVAERARLDFDEFVAALWAKGVRYGIDAAAVRAAIARDKAERLAIGRATPPQPGKDASILEQTDALHRDDSPRILPDGRMDLRQFRNRFPQVAEGTRLFRKVPRVAGVSGWNVLGRELAPDAVKDFDIATLAGPGTRIERDGAGNEYVVAALAGFLDIDVKSNQLSVSEKIVHREGVSIRSTGDLTLSGDEYEEHGDVQEKRVVEGHHMTFLANVFGSIVSDGGRVLIKQTISGGAAKSPGGSVVVEGSASRATLEASRGSVDVALAESSLLLGQVVRVGRAVNCQIVADEVVVESAEGCAIAGRSVTIGQARPRRDEGTVVTLLLPDAPYFETAIAATEAEREAAMASLSGIKETRTQLVAQADLKTYLTLQPKIKAGTLVMTPEQDANWRRLLARAAPALRELARLNGEMQALQESVDEAAQRAAALEQEHAAAVAAVRCSIGEAGTDTLVRTRVVAAGAPPLASLPARELQQRLREAGTAEQRIFAGTGSFEWPPAT